MDRRRSVVDDRRVVSAIDGFTLAVAYVRHIAEQLRAMGVSVEAWLARSALSEASLQAPALSLSRAAFERLVIDAMEMADEPALGLFVGERLVASTHGILGFAALNSGSIREAVGVFERFIAIRTSMLEVAIDDDDPRLVRVQLREVEPLLALQRPVLEAVVTSMKNLLDALSMGAVPVQTVAFSFDAPPYTALVDELFRCEVVYGQRWTGFALDRRTFDAPLKLADPAAFREAAEICQRELDKLASNESLAARVRRLLVQQQNGFPSLESAARRLHMTPRTLHRRLVAEGTSFKSLLEDVRRTLALAHLRAGRFSVEQIAYMLGYSDVSNFRRAFKRWESVPPSRRRARTTP